jgi:hypothetical protein
VFKMPTYVYNPYLVEFTKYGNRVTETLHYLDVVGEPRRRIGDSVTVNVNKQKRIGIILGVG